MLVSGAETRRIQHCFQPAPPYQAQIEQECTRDVIGVHNMGILGLLRGVLGVYWGCVRGVFGVNLQRLTGGGVQARLLVAAVADFLRAPTSRVHEIQHSNRYQSITHLSVNAHTHAQTSTEKEREEGIQRPWRACSQ